MQHPSKNFILFLNMIFLFDYSLTMLGNYDISPRSSIALPRARVNSVSNFIIKYLIKIFKKIFFVQILCKKLFFGNKFYLKLVLFYEILI